MTETTPTSVTKRALRVLVADGSIDEQPADAPDRVVAEATRATGRVESAVEFLAADGVERLARAVVAAGREDDTETVRRGREALSTLRAFRVALDGPTGSADGDRDHDREGHGGRDESRPSTSNTGSTAATATDHFHSGRGTVLGGGGKRRDR